jgi:hypothetical protein
VETVAVVQALPQLVVMATVAALQQLAQLAQAPTLEVSGVPHQAAMPVAIMRAIAVAHLQYLAEEVVVYANILVSMV